METWTGKQRFSTKILNVLGEIFANNTQKNLLLK